MVPRVAVGLGGFSLPNGPDDPSVRRDRSARLSPKFEGQHPSPMSLIGDGLRNPSDATVTAALDQSSMEEIVGSSPGEEITFSERRLHLRGGLLELVGDGPS